MLDSAASPSPEAKIIFGKYELGRLLGRGASAKVYHARHIPSGHSVAIKVFPKPRPSSSSSLPDDTTVAVLREISALRRLRHRHIIRLHEVLATRTKIYLVLELAKGGELFSRVASRGHLTEDESRRLFRQLLSAVAFGHARGVFHRDIKPENLLIGDSGELKVSDFGLSAVCFDHSSSSRLLHTLCGTPAYVAPELLMKKGYDGAKVDLWSCGVVLFVLNAGYLPFNDPNLMAMYRKIYGGQFRCPRWTSPDLRRLLVRLLDPNPESRITVEEILHEPWFNKGGFSHEDWTELMRPLYDSDDEICFAGDASPSLKLEKDFGRELNAFDIISFGLDLSGLLDRGLNLDRFTSIEPVEVMLERVEEAGKKEGLVVRRRGEKYGYGVVVEGQNGNLIVKIDFYRLAAGTLLVEADNAACGGCGGAASAAAGGDFWTRKLGPVLKGVDRGSVPPPPPTPVQ